MFINSNNILQLDGAHVLNGRGYGAVGSLLGEVRYEPGLLRPFVDDRGETCVLVNAGRKPDGSPDWKKHRVADLQARGINSPVFNANTLTKDAWIELDRTVLKAARQRLRAWTDLAAASSRGGFNAMARATLEYQSMNDPGFAVVDMDALSEGLADRPMFDIKSVPLPITHSDFWFSDREIAISKNGGAPLDTTMAEAAGRRVAETIEQTLIGTVTGLTYGTRSTGPVPHVSTNSNASRVYGYTNFPFRSTKTDLTTPTGTNPEAIMTDILEMIETMQGNGYYGPYILYHSTGYSRYLSDDYFRTGSTSAVRSVRERIMEIEGIQDVRRLDYLTSGYQMILVQMSSDVVQAINGMEITTVQWPSQGGMRQNFKVMCIKVPLLKATYAGTTGIVHGTTS